MKKLNETFNGDVNKQIQTILNILWAIRNDDKFYFYEYGKDLLERYISENKEQINGLKNHIESLRTQHEEAMKEIFANRELLKK